MSTLKPSPTYLCALVGSRHNWFLTKSLHTTHLANPYVFRNDELENPYIIRNDELNVLVKLLVLKSQQYTFYLCLKP